MLELDEISHAYDSASPVLDNVGLRLGDGEIGCLLGPSGCGKTTLLRCVAGFEIPLRGTIRLRGSWLVSPELFIPAEKRRIGMVFQDYALLPHLSVAGNVMFGLRDLARSERERRAGEMLEVVGLSGFATAYPHELSGGQQQRVALARALAPRPRLLLMDEPFAHLDPALRERLFVDVKAILHQQGSTVLIVSHDPREAFALADRLGVMRAGSLLQWDEPYTVYHEPTSRFVAEFVGPGAWLPGRVAGDGRIETELGMARGSPQHPLAQGRPVELLLRPEDVVSDESSPLRARLVERVFRGGDFLCTLALDSGRQVYATLSSQDDHDAGDRIGIRLGPRHLVAFETSEP
ncbi:MAG: ABC transporter ATP-binding protein [Chromatiales bacterium]|nr:ABC transporter ATP-binding protein [Chromatiales bacterium]